MNANVNRNTLENTVTKVSPLINIISNSVTEKLCAFVKYPVALGIVEVSRGRLHGQTREDLY